MAHCGCHDWAHRSPRIQLQGIQLVGVEREHRCATLLECFAAHGCHRGDSSLCQENLRVVRLVARTLVQTEGGTGRQFGRRTDAPSSLDQWSICDHVAFHLASIRNRRGIDFSAVGGDEHRNRTDLERNLRTRAPGHDGESEHCSGTLRHRIHLQHGIPELRPGYIGSAALRVQRDRNFGRSSGDPVQAVQGARSVKKVQKPPATAMLHTTPSPHGSTHNQHRSRIT